MNLIKISALCLSIGAVLSLAAFNRHQQEPWNTNQLMQPAELAKKIGIQ